jgi:hypothetical protein
MEQVTSVNLSKDAAQGARKAIASAMAFLFRIKGISAALVQH